MLPYIYAIFITGTYKTDGDELNFDLSVNVYLKLFPA